MRVFRNVELGLTELHKRFLLRERTLIIEVTAGKQTYVLDPRYSASNTSSRETNKYIQDVGDVFKGGLFKVERVYDADDVELPLDDHNEESSVRTSSFNTLLLPDDYSSTVLKVVCRTDHEPIKSYMVEGVAQQIEISLPGTHLLALLLFVASRLLNPVGMSDTFHEGNNYAAKFEAECERLTDTNFALQRQYEATRFTNNGWV
jgi:hypothetical protein